LTKNSLTQKELLEKKGATWTCEYQDKVGSWESPTLKKGIAEIITENSRLIYKLIGSLERVLK